MIVTSSLQRKLLTTFTQPIIELKKKDQLYACQNRSDLHDLKSIVLEEELSHVLCTKLSGVNTDEHLY